MKFKFQLKVGNLEILLRLELLHRIIYLIRNKIKSYSHHLNIYQIKTKKIVNKHLISYSNKSSNKIVLQISRAIKEINQNHL